MSRVSRVFGTTVASLAMAATLLTTTACEQARNAIDCVQFAGKITQDVASLQNVVSDPAAAGRALDDLQGSLTKSVGDLDSSDARDAAGKLQNSVGALKDRVTSGERLSADDLTPLVTGAGELLAKCSS